MKSLLPVHWSSPASVGGCGTTPPDRRQSPSLLVVSTGFHFLSVLFVIQTLTKRKMNVGMQAALSNSSLLFKTVRQEWNFSSYYIKSLNLQYIFRIKYSVFKKKLFALQLCITTFSSAKPFNEAIRLNGRSYQNCEEVYLSESTDDLLSSLSCTTSSKPSSRLSWTSDPATPALVVNQSTAAECNTAANGIVTCESNTTIVTKDLEDLVHVTCVTHYDDGQTVMTSKRACVVLVPFGQSPMCHSYVVLF